MSRRLEKVENRCLTQKPVVRLLRNGNVSFFLSFYTNVKIMMYTVTRLYEDVKQYVLAVRMRILVRQSVTVDLHLPRKEKRLQPIIYFRYVSFSSRNGHNSKFELDFKHFRRFSYESSGKRCVLIDIN